MFNSVEWDNKLPACVLCDLDGTFAMHTGRTPFEWERIEEDEPDMRLRLILETLSNKQPIDIIFLTGRPNNVEEQTRKWIEDNYIGDYKLLMRNENDWSSGNICKKNIYEKYIKGNYNVVCVFEDSNKCVEMWREQGLLTLQVQNSDY